MLYKKLIPLAFGQGLDTKKDKKQQVYGTLRKAENVVFETLDSARKRNGYDSVLLQTVDGDGVTTSQYLSKFKNELLVFDNSKLYSFSETMQNLQSKGSTYSVFPTSWPVLNNGYSVVELDMLLVQGLKFFVYRNTTTNEVRYCVQDQTNQAMLVSDALVATSARTPKLANIGNIVYILYGTGTDIRCKNVNILNPASISASTVTITTDYNATNSNMDVVSTGSQVIIAYCTSVNEVALVSIDLNFIATPPIDFTSQICSNGLDIMLDSIGRLVVSYASTTAVKYFIYSSNLLNQIVSPTLIETVATAPAKVTSVESAANSYLFLYGISAVNTYNHYIKKNTVTGLTTVGTPSVFLRSVCLATKPFKVDDSIYTTVSYDSISQPTYFVVDASGVVVSKVSPGVSGGHLLRNTLPEAYVVDGLVLVPSLYRTKFVAENDDFSSLTGVLNTELNFTLQDRYDTAALGNNLLINGGIVQAYDGNVVTEHGFHLYPESPTITHDTSSTPMNNSTRQVAQNWYQYCIVYKWTDMQGQEHRSAPSVPVDVNVNSGATNAVVLTIPTLRLTQKQNVIIEIYRNEGGATQGGGGTIFYLVNSISYAPFFNSTSVDTVTFVDGRSDASIISSRALYTTGGVLENIAAPSAKIVATHTASNRIFLAGLEDPNIIQYSKIVSQNQPVEFNDTLQITIDPVGGPITALVSMDEKLIVFERDAIFFISGGGPNNAGLQNTFTTAERVSVDVGCIQPKSIVLTPDGLMFKSRKGIYLLSRVLGLSYIGAPVEAYNNLTISSAKIVAELNQVRFTTSDGDALIFNTVYKFWATFTNHKAKSAEVLGNDYYYLRSNGQLFKENRESFSDAGVPIKMRLEIGWISFTTLQGYSRIYKMLILGDWLSRHNLLVKVGFDFNEGWTQSALITPETAQIDAGTYGEDSPYGEPTGKPYGGYGNPYQMRVNFKKQKCESIRLEIEDVQATAGAGFSLSQITFEVGGKSGLFKLSKGKKFAMS